MYPRVHRRIAWPLNSDQKYVLPSKMMPFGQFVLAESPTPFPELEEPLPTTVDTVRLCKSTRLMLLAFWLAMIRLLGVSNTIPKGPLNPPRRTL